MLRKAPTDFRFVVKLFQDLSHGAKPADDAMQEFKRSLAPFGDPGGLPVLAQFPWSFKNTRGGGNGCIGWPTNWMSIPWSWSSGIGAGSATRRSSGCGSAISPIAAWMSRN